ncbi:MAG TPA: YwiC-like family protein [Candidatus Sulfotelmatobacter sp.]|nr:YwiC-like family protein [Candidatus Sulfotelmatobacter sp.]
MSTTIDLEPEQTEWVNHVTQILGARNPAEAMESDLHANEVKVTATDSHSDKARRERRHALLFPREHGAWGLLLVPIITGAGVAFRECSHIFPLLLLSTAALSLFWLRTPFESLIGTSAMRAETNDERHAIRSAIFGLAIVAAIALGGLLWAGQNSYLWPLGAAAGLAFIMQAVLRKLSRKLRMLSEIVGTIGLTASAPAAYYVITGKFNGIAWMLWIANILFAGDQIHYVQLRIHTAKVDGFRAKLARGWRFALGQALMTAVITFACLNRLMPPLASLAFAPLLFRGWFYFVQEPGPLVVRRLGWNEMKHAAAFCVIFIATFTLAR